jgi:L-aspartate oxidase
MKIESDFCHENVVRMVVEEGPKTIRNLIEWGVKFTTSSGSDDYDPDP